MVYRRKGLFFFLFFRFSDIFIPIRQHDDWYVALNFFNCLKLVQLLSEFRTNFAVMLTTALFVGKKIKAIPVTGREGP
jgi:hypothetical protein